jgi:hypothetical protein
VKIAGMVLWVLTAGIGGYLLAVGFAAQRTRREAAEAEAAAATQAGGAEAQAGAGRAEPGRAGRAEPGRAEPGRAEPGRAEPGAGRAQMARQMQVVGELLPQDEAVVMGSAAMLSGVVPEASVAGGPGAGGSRAEIEGSPLLEFMHPALALTGLTLWIFYTVSGDRLFAWIGFGIVLAAVLAGVGWATMSKRVERRRTVRRAAAEGEPGAGASGAGAGGAGAGGQGFPDHLVLLHGAAALCTLALVAVCLFAVVRL